VHVNLELSRADRQQLLQLRDVLQRYPGSCKAYLHLRSPGQTEAVIELPGGIHLKAGAALRREVSEVLGDNALETRCAPV
jgi:DNA polymerase III subunit alpha